MIQSFRHIREDIIKTAYASYVMELTEKTIEYRDPDPYIYNELIHTLIWINGQDDYIIPVMMYELKLFDKGGFAPVVDRCARCHSIENLVSFSVQNGGLLCETCQNTDERAIVIEQHVVKMLPILLRARLEQVGTISVKEKNKQLLRLIMDNYYDTYGGFSLKSKRFLSQIKLL